MAIAPANKEQYPDFWSHQDISDLRAYAQQVSDSTDDPGIKQRAAHYLPRPRRAVFREVMIGLRNSGLSVPPRRVWAEIKAIEPTVRITSMIATEILFNIRNKEVKPKTSLPPLSLPETTAGLTSETPRGNNFLVQRLRSGILGMSRFLRCVPGLHG